MRGRGDIGEVEIYCKTRFDSDGLTAAKIATKMIAIVGIFYRNYTHYILYGSCTLIYRIAIVRSLSFLFHFLMILKEMLTFPSLANPVLQ